MDSEQQPHAVTEEHVPSAEPTVVVVERGGVFRVLLRVLFYPFHGVVRVYRGCLWVLGFRQPMLKAQTQPAVSSSPRHNLTSRKRLHPITRLLLYTLPRWLQGFLGFPVYRSIGRSISPEIRTSPTKPHGKGSKRKQEDLEDEEDDEEDEQEDEQTWVDVLNQDIPDEDEGPDQDPDYEPSSVSTESEYCSQNSTQSDIEVQEKGVVIIEDVQTDSQSAASPEDPTV